MLLFLHKFGIIGGFHFFLINYYLYLDIDPFCLYSFLHLIFEIYLKYGVIFFFFL
jgi:hypothetical protein